MIDALAFVPIADIPIALNVLQNNVPDPRVLPLLDYFVCTYIEGRPVPNANPPRPSPPMFPPTIWYVFKVTLASDGTNSICEGSNHAFNALVGQLYPFFYVALDALQKDYVITKRNILLSQRGSPLAQRIRHDVQTYNRNVTALCRQYQNNTYQNNILGYLRRISYNIRFK